MSPDSAYFCGRQVVLPAKYASIALLRNDRESLGKHSNQLGTDRQFRDWVSLARNLLELRVDAALKCNDYFGWLDQRKIEVWLRETSMNYSRRRIKALSQVQNVTSDRLHVHILCDLMGRKHQVVDNCYGKITSYYDTWGWHDDVSKRP